MTKLVQKRNFIMTALAISMMAMAVFIMNPVEVEAVPEPNKFVTGFVSTHSSTGVENRMLPEQSNMALPDKVPDHARDRIPNFIVEHENLRAEFIPNVISFSNPSNFETDGEGTALLTFNNKGWGCSGTLIADDTILTASHCISNSKGVVDAFSGKAFFGNVDDTTGNWDFTSDYSYDIVEFIKHPRYDGKFWNGNDIAVLKISGIADASIPRIGIDSDDSDTVGQRVSLHGFGYGGWGAYGALYDFGTLRTGENTIDDYHGTMMKYLGLKNKQYLHGAVIQSDFDNGLVANDGFGFFFGNPHTGIGSTESKICSGDSGGSIRNSNGDVTGVNSYTARLSNEDGTTSDYTQRADCSFGEFSGYANVAYYSDWLNSEMNEEPDNKCSNPKSKKPECR